ncbi:heavy metal-associated domain protein [Cutibacterium acnes JCM 18909]|nr:heavy metal-associated domain protein [Cutibacterium acnes JCM 18909]
MHKTYTINGMTCEHCVKAITEEVSALDGVDNVTVSLESGSMTIDSAEEIPFGKVADAVDEAGEYTVAEASSLDTAGHPGGQCGCGGHGHAGRKLKDRVAAAADTSTPRRLLLSMPSTLVKAAVAAADTKPEPLVSVEILTSGPGLGPHDAVRPRPPTLTFPTTHRPPGSLGLPVREPVAPDIPDSGGSSTKETHAYPDSPRRAV